MMRAPMNDRGFTLVELMVIVTIIVVLLALLMPAMAKAVYAARLVACSANQRLTASAAIQYTFSNARAYPSRPAVPAGGPNGPPSGVSAWTVYLPPDNIPSGYDLKPVLRQKLNLDPNIAFQCPLIERIDFDERLDDEWVYGNTAIWFDWRYITDVTYAINQNVNGTRVRAMSSATELERMRRLGDRFEWKNRRYNLLVSDIDLYRPWSVGAQTAHPDVSAGIMHNAVFIRVNIAAGAALPHTASFWYSPSSRRGTVDHNYAYDDNSVRLVTGIDRQDPRLDAVPATFNNRDGRDVVQIPPG